MIIHLKKNERLFINGAVIRLDRRGSIELMNDAQFLLASHVMQVEEATSPLRRLYFVVQTMIIDPTSVELTKSLFVTHVQQLRNVVQDQGYLNLLADLGELIVDAEYFEALRLLRKNFHMDAALAADPAQVGAAVELDGKRARAA